MLRIARELSETETSSFSIFEDVPCESDEGPFWRHVEVQTEISCDHVALATEVSIPSNGKEDSNECPDVLFWRAVATQRASELDCLREEIEKIESLTIQNIIEKQAMDKKHDELYTQLQRILQDGDDVEDSDPPENVEQQPK